MSTGRRFDPITFELMRNTLSAIADEMSITILRTAYSTMIREAKDCGTGILDAKGQLVVYGWGTFVHLGSLPALMEVLLSRYKNDLKPGDIFIANDPYHGGMHLPDTFVVKPMFVNGKLLCFLVCTGHQVDMGGRVPGSSAPDSTEIYQEGLRMPPLKLYDGGVKNETMWTMIQENVRVPIKVLGDVNALISACFVAEQQLQGLVKKYDADTLTEYFRELLDYSERLARAEFQTWPKGTWHGEAFIDDDGFQTEPIPIRCALTIEGDEITIDFTGSSPPVRGAINCTPSFIKSGCYGGIRSAMETDIPNNQGYFRPIKFIIPPHSILNPDPPAPVAARGVTGGRAGSALRRALAQALPGRLSAEGGDLASIRIGGQEPGFGPWVVSDSITGTGGARPNKDGIDGIAGTYRNLPVEVAEAEYPMRYWQYGFLQDSGGPGKFRGGLSIVREWELLGRDAVFSIRADKMKFPSEGLQGGKPGVPSYTVLNPGTDREKAVPGKCSMRIERGDHFYHRLNSGGGYGDPMERDPEAVLQDWLEDKVSAEHARTAYGVVIDLETREVDSERTSKLRRETRRRSR